MCHCLRLLLNCNYIVIKIQKPFIHVTVCLKTPFSLYHYLVMKKAKTCLLRRTSSFKKQSYFPLYKV